MAKQESPVDPKPTKKRSLKVQVKESDLGLETAESVKAEYVAKLAEM